jgi:hypothetical protein
VLLGWFRTKSEITLIRGWREISKGEEYVKPILDYNVE